MVAFGNFGKGSEVVVDFEDQIARCKASSFDHNALNRHY